MTVPAQQPREVPCKLALLGEAPGEVEVAEGRPFCGPSGRILRAALRTADIEPEACWIGNVFEEKADGNDVSPWLRDPIRVTDALGRLGRDLAEAQPTVIVPLGATALWALTEATDISRMRGAPALASRVCPGRKIMPSFHPAFVLRQYKLLPLLVGDLIKAAAEAEKGPELFIPFREFYLEPSLDDVREWVTGQGGAGQGLARLGRAGYGMVDGRGKEFPCLLEAPLLSVDIETSWGQITCIGFAPDHEHAICIPFVDLRRSSRSYWRTAEEEIQAWLLVKAVLESPVPKLGQNYGAYDAYWLLKEMGIRTMNLLHDTRLMHHALHPELPKDLASLAAAYSELPNWKSWNRHKENKRDA